MTNPQITGIGTATPLHSATQSESLKMFQDIVCETDRQQRLAKVLFRRSGVKNRHFVVPYKAAYTWCEPAGVEVGSMASQSIGFESLPSIQEPDALPEVAAGQSPGPTTAERMSMYAHFASDLAVESSSAALEDSAIDPQNITHLVTVCCTGFNSPGVDFDLIERLDLPRTTQRLHIGFMGCHAAINGIRAARAIAASDSEANVLVCCVELCSLHYRFQWDNDAIVANALFADGSAALVIRQQSNPEPSQPRPRRLTVIDTGSVMIPASKDQMSWQVGNHGFKMMLSSEVGASIEENLSEWLSGWLADHGLDSNQIDYWAVHPGGPKILDAVEASMQLPEEALTVSRGVLANYGNMSSPTILFILQQFAQRHAESELESGYCLLIAFGPGLVSEIALVKFE